jgi:hypothetical protein
MENKVLKKGERRIENREDGCFIHIARKLIVGVLI